jgi:purine-nucleoside phosphorylase
MLQAKIEEAVQFIKSKNITPPNTGIVLGTGLNALVKSIDVSHKIEYIDIPHFPVSTVEFHKGMLIFGTIEEIPVVVMQGRFHYYEGYSTQEITFPVRVMKELGISNLLLSNAAGGINTEFKKGDLVITNDHINLLPDNPLRGLGAEFGNQFVDMMRTYDVELMQTLEAAFRDEQVVVKKGVYASVMGPNLETKAEYRWLRI